MEKFVALKLALEKLAEEVDGEIKPYTTEEARKATQKHSLTVKNIGKLIGRSAVGAGVGHVLGMIPAAAYGVYAKNKLNMLGNSRGIIDGYAHYKLDKRIAKILDIGTLIGRSVGSTHGIIAGGMNIRRKTHEHLMQTDPRYRKWDELPEEDK